VFSTDIGHEVLLIRILQGLLEYAICHILLSEGKGGDLFGANELDRSVRIRLHHLSSKVGSALDAALLIVLSHPSCGLQKRPKLDLLAKLLTSCRVRIPHE